MIVTNIIGGLGNQMFQYALGRSLSLSRNCELALDLTEMKTYHLHPFDLPAFQAPLREATVEEIRKSRGFAPRPRNPLVRRLKRLYFERKNYVLEKGLHFQGERLNRLGPNGYVEGYWQNENYFLKHRSTILKDFQLREKGPEVFEDLQNEMQTTNSVSLHVRRGNYISDARTLSIHGVCSADYYVHALGLFRARLQDPVFYIFSDDPEWCRQNLNLDVNCVFVSGRNNHLTPAQEMVLMSRCRHHIIANSTFSWWGAWLNPFDDKIVVAPKKWFAAKDNRYDSRDIVPKSWLQI